MDQNQNREIDTVIFDLGGVLITFSPEGGMRKMGFPEDVIKVFLEKIYSGVWAACDGKQYSEAGIREMFKTKVPGYEEYVDKLWDNVTCITGVQPYSEEWLTDLKSRGLKLYVLSNYGNVSWAKNSPLYDFLKYMDGMLISFELEMVKPNPEIYQALLDRYPSIDPSRAVFIDDVKANAEGASAVGIRGIWFRSYDQVRADLLQAMGTGSLAQPD